MWITKKKKTSTMHEKWDDNYWLDDTSVPLE